jgi:hypothetical protein
MELPGSAHRLGLKSPQVALSALPLQDWGTYLVIVVVVLDTVVVVVHSASSDGRSLTTLTFA